MTLVLLLVPALFLSHVSTCPISWSVSAMSRQWWSSMMFIMSSFHVAFEASECLLLSLYRIWIHCQVLEGVVFAIRNKVQRRIKLTTRKGNGPLGIIAISSRYSLRYSRPTKHDYLHSKFNLLIYKSPLRVIQLPRDSYRTIYLFHHYWDKFSRRTTVQGITFSRSYIPNY